MRNHMVEHAERTRYWQGALFALAAVSIWASWMPVTRLSVTTTLNAFDLAFMRFAVAGLLLLPTFLKARGRFARLRWWQLALIVAGAGAPYSFVAASGLAFAPAAHAGALTPGVMPLFAAALAATFLSERITAKRATGYGLIVLGVIGLVGHNLASGPPGQGIGHVLFLCAALMWATYTTVLRGSDLRPLEATALVAVGSAVVAIPAYLLTQGTHFLQAPAHHIVLQAAYQGVVATVLSLFLFGRAVSVLGAAPAASFGALVPALAAVLAIPVLGEWPSAADWVTIALISGGVLFASGAPLAAAARYTLGARVPSVRIAEGEVDPCEDRPARDLRGAAT